MKKFKVSLNEEIGGFAIIEANNIDEAEVKAEDIMTKEGIEGFKNMEITFRDASVRTVEEEEQR
jgi:hypothetical protein